MEPEIDTQQREHALSRPGPAIALVGGLLLFSCLFMPAVVRLGRPIRPIEVPWLAWPHFMGMLTAVGAGLALMRDRSGAMVIALSLYLLALAAVIGTSLAWWTHQAELSALLVGLAYALVATLPRRPWHLARAVWICGSLASAWIGLATAFEMGLHGLWLALSGSLLLFVGGVLWELDAHARAAYGARSVPERAVPRARVVHTVRSRGHAGSIDNRYM